jgi:DNA-binding NarL/FixJ family response regulator
LPELNRPPRAAKKRSESSTLRTVAALIRETHPRLWQILQSSSLRDVTIGQLLSEAKAAPAADLSNLAGGQVLPFQKYLTEREAQVAAYIAQGASNKEIGEHLKLSAKTVKNHVSNILKKLGLQRRTQVVVMALRHDKNGGQRRSAR